MIIPRSLWMIGVEQLGTISACLHKNQVPTRVLWDPGSDIIHLAMNHNPAIVWPIVFIDFI